MAPGAGTGWPSCPGPAWRTCAGVFPGSRASPTREARAISATCAGCRVWSVYVPNGRALDSPHLAYKLSWLAALRDALAADLSPGGDGSRLAVCGDFNIAPHDDDVWDPAAFTGSTHVTPEERAALGRLLDLGLTDVPARALKGRPFTYWDYRAGMFHKGMGMRIDLVLASGAVATAVKDAYIDREARKGKGRPTTRPSWWTWTWTWTRTGPRPPDPPSARASWPVAGFLPGGPPILGVHGCSCLVPT